MPNPVGASQINCAPPDNWSDDLTGAKCQSAFESTHREAGSRPCSTNSSDRVESFDARTAIGSMEAEVLYKEYRTNLRQLRSTA